MYNGERIENEKKFGKYKYGKRKLWWVQKEKLERRLSKIVLLDG